MERKYKVGDKVRIVSERVFMMDSDGGMDHWLGKVMTIYDFYGGSGYYMREDNCEWFWDDSMIAGLVQDEMNFQDLFNTSPAEKETKQEEAPLTAQEAFETYHEIQKKCASGAFNCINCPLIGIDCRIKTAGDLNIPELLNRLSEYRRKEIPLADLKIGEKFSLSDTGWIVLDIREDGYACLGNKIERNGDPAFDPECGPNDWSKSLPGCVNAEIRPFCVFKPETAVIKIG